ncbi:MAG: polysaccharide deacetylase family protein [Elusimicrobiota bacterium]
MLKSIKRAALGFLKTAGVTGLLHDSGWRRRRLAILAYHGISLADEHLWNGAQYISAGVFRGRMQALKDLGCSVLPLGEAVSRLAAGDLPVRAVALTFDDGTSDFGRVAHPILKEFGFPVTLYLTTFYTEFHRPVFDLMCSYLLWKGRGGSLDLPALVGRGAPTDLRDAAARDAARDRIFAYARERKLKAGDKDALAASLARAVGVDYDSLIERRLLHNLAPDEVRGLARDGVDIQLHTHRHRTPLDRELFLREIRDNRESIRRMTGADAVHFCYPSGVHHPAFLPWLREAGVVSATTCESGLASRSSDPLLLPRLLDVSGLSDGEFEGLLSGAASLLPRRQEPR